MATNITIDDSLFQKNISKLSKKIIPAQVEKGLREIAEELLRLSQLEVPLDIGTLQASGNIQKQSGNEYIVGYNTVYAAKMHEHPEYNFQHGRKGKYLEDPLKHNNKKFIKYFADTIKEIT